MNSRLSLERMPVAGLVCLAAIFPSLTTSVFLLAQRSHGASDFQLGLIVGAGIGMSLVCGILAVVRKRMEA